MPHTPLKIVIAYFGITRSLPDTLSSIQENVVESCRQFAQTESIAHLYDLKNVKNTRSDENTPVDRHAYKQLDLDQIEHATPNSAPIRETISRIKGYGDYWDDEGQSLSNLIHQLHSLSHVTEMARNRNADVVVFCRPDILYHDSFSSGLKKALNAKKELALLPYWQQYQGGYNDRFAICRGSQAISAYGSRLKYALDYCMLTGQPLHSESLLRFSLETANIRVRMLNVTGSRVRANGIMVDENFSIRRWKIFRNGLHYQRRIKA